MKPRKTLIIAFVGLLLIGAICAGVLKWRGFRATSAPSTFETVAARSVRDFAIPSEERRKRNPDAGDSLAIQQGREDFLTRCASCHGVDARGRTPIGANVYPRVPDLHSDATQNLTDGEIHYIIENGVQFSGMPAMASPHRESAAESWKLVSYIRSFRPLTSEEKALEANTFSSAHYIGSQACQKCHADIYDRWKKDTDGERRARSARAPGCDHSRSQHQHRREVYERSGGLCLRQHVEATLLHQGRR